MIRFFSSLIAFGFLFLSHRLSLSLSLLYPLWLDAFFLSFTLCLSRARSRAYIHTQARMHPNVFSRIHIHHLCISFVCFFNLFLVFCGGFWGGLLCFSCCVDLFCGTTTVPIVWVAIMLFEIMF